MLHDFKTCTLYSACKFPLIASCISHCVAMDVKLKTGIIPEVGWLDDWFSAVLSSCKRQIAVYFAMTIQASKLSTCLDVKQNFHNSKRCIFKDIMTSKGVFLKTLEQLTKHPYLSYFTHVRKLPVPGRPSTFAYSGARACCACSRCGTGGLFLFIYFHLSSLSDVLSFGRRLNMTEICGFGC